MSELPGRFSPCCSSLVAFRTKNRPEPLVPGAGQPPGRPQGDQLRAGRPGCPLTGKAEGDLSCGSTFFETCVEVNQFSGKLGGQLL